MLNLLASNWARGFLSLLFQLYNFLDTTQMLLTSLKCLILHKKEGHGVNLRILNF